MSMTPQLLLWVHLPLDSMWDMGRWQVQFLSGF
jgi:hypothetical protein